MRIASISKPLTCTLACVLYEQGKLPEFKWADKRVEVTCRQLMSHSAGIRHYNEGKKEAK